MKGVHIMTLYIFLILILLIFIGIPVGLGFGIAAIIKYEKKRSGNKFVQPAPDVYGPFYRPPQPPPKPKTKLSASAVMLLIGTIFIMLSAITFVAANWINMEPSGRVFTLAGVAVVAFALCAVLKAAVHLERTSAAFYMLGTLIGLVAFCTAGVYELFGEWFSFMGMGCGLYLAVSSSLVAVSAFAGGTGKTPVVEFLSRTLAARGRKCAILTRGYKSADLEEPQVWLDKSGRRIKRLPKIASDGTTRYLSPLYAGDEPFMLARNLDGFQVIVLR